MLSSAVGEMWWKEIFLVVIFFLSVALVIFYARRKTTFVVYFFSPLTRVRRRIWKSCGEYFIGPSQP